MRRLWGELMCLSLMLWSVSACGGYGNWSVIVILRLTLCPSLVCLYLCHSLFFFFAFVNCVSVSVCVFIVFCNSDSMSASVFVVFGNSLSKFGSISLPVVN